MNDPVDDYCERLGPGLWGEPLNAITNLAFLLAAGLLAWLVCRQRRQGTSPPASVVALPVLVAVVGLCSLSFHTLATTLTAALDSLSILVFILVALPAHLHWGWGLAWRRAILVVPGFVVFAVLVEGILVLAVHNPLGGYLPALLALVILAVAYGRSALPIVRRESRWLLLAGVVFAVSLTLRSVDGTVCASLPIGTHWLWHILNAVVLFLVSLPIIRVWTATVTSR